MARQKNAWVILDSQTEVSTKIIYHLDKSGNIIGASQAAHDLPNGKRYSCAMCDAIWDYYALDCPEHVFWKMLWQYPKVPHTHKFRCRICGLKDDNPHDHNK